MKVLVFRVMVDLLETVLFILPVHERGRKYKWENIEDLLFTLLVCGFMNAVVIYLMALYQYGKSRIFQFSQHRNSDRKVCDSDTFPVWK